MSLLDILAHATRTGTPEQWGVSGDMIEDQLGPEHALVKWVRTHTIDVAWWCKFIGRSVLDSWIANYDWGESRRLFVTADFELLATKHPALWFPGDIQYQFPLTDSPWFGAPGSYCPGWHQSPWDSESAQFPRIVYPLWRSSSAFRYGAFRYGAFRYGTEPRRVSIEPSGYPIWWNWSSGQAVVYSTCLVDPRWKRLAMVGNQVELRQEGLCSLYLGPAGEPIPGPPDGWSHPDKFSRLVLLEPAVTFSLTEENKA